MKHRYVLEDANGSNILLESEQPVEAEAIVLSMLTSIEREEILKPYPNEHACRVADPDGFSDFRRGTVDAGGKELGIIYGKKGEDWVEQSFRFKKGVWTVAEARAFCSNHGGKFEAALTTGQPEIPGEEPGSGAAQKSEPLTRKAEVESLPRPVEVEIQVHIAKAEAKRQLVYGVAMEPHQLDTYNDWESPEEIEWAAHQFLLRSQFLDDPVIGSEHERPIAAAPVESYIAPVDFWFDGTPQDEEHLVRKGSWVLVAKVFDKEEFAKIESEEYTGWSIQGTGYRQTNDVLEESA